MRARHGVGHGVEPNCQVHDRRPCLPPNTGKLLTRGPAPRQHILAAAIRPATASATDRVHRHNVRHTTKSNFAGFTRIHAAIDTHNKCYAGFKDFSRAALSFLREKVPRNWHVYCYQVTDNFRVIDRADFRVLA
jgi:hypothetical protein